CCQPLIPLFPTRRSSDLRSRDDIAVFPLAMPLLAGPGAISAVILLTTGTRTDLEFWAVLLAVVVILFIAWLTLLVAIPIQRLLGDRKSTRLNSSHVKISY